MNKEDLFEQELRKELQSITYPRQVDVVDRVMEQVTKQRNVKKLWWQGRGRVILGSVAASVAAVVALGLIWQQQRQNAEENVGLMLNAVTAYVHGYAEETESEAENHFAYIEEFIGAGDEIK